MKHFGYVFFPLVLCGCASTVSLQETSFYDQGKAALASKSFAVAKSKFQLALNDVNYKAPALNGLAATMFEMNDDESALAFIRSARAIDGTSEYLKNNEAKILARVEANKRVARTATEIEPVILGKVDVTPAIVDFSAGSSMLPLGSLGPQIEVTNTRPAPGYERVLPTAQLEQVSPGVFNLVLSPRGQDVATAQDLSNIAVALGSDPALPRQRHSTLSDKANPSTKAAIASLASQRITYAQTNQPNARIAIANGSGVKGVACGAAESFRKAGISVASCADYKTKDGKVNFKQNETVVYVNRDSKLDPELILKLLRSSNAKRLVVTDLVATKFDVQVVLGKDRRAVTRRA